MYLTETTLQTITTKTMEHRTDILTINEEGLVAPLHFLGRIAGLATPPTLIIMIAPATHLLTAEENVILTAPPSATGLGKLRNLTINCFQFG